MINQNKAQTATEYLIILAVVIVIALIVIGVLGGIPSIGGGVSKSTQLAQLSAKEVGVTNYAFQTNYAKFKIKNNQANTIKINSLWVDQIPCGSNDPMFPFQLKVGETKTITCWNLDTDNEKFNDLFFEYVNLETSSTYTTANGKTGVEVKGISLTDCNGTDADGDTYYDICTCDDLNDTRNNLTRNYELLYNIDFLESSCSVYREGSGWVPIGSSSPGFVKNFNGNNFTINNLYINRPSEDQVGLFGYAYLTSTPYNVVTSLGLINAKIIGNDRVGTLVGYGYYYYLSDIYSTGIVTGSNRVGGLIGMTYNLHSTNAKVSSLISCSGVNCGGFGGYSIYNTFAGPNTWLNTSGDSIEHCIGSLSPAPAGTDPANCDVINP